MSAADTNPGLGPSLSSSGGGMRARVGESGVRAHPEGSDGAERGEQGSGSRVKFMVEREVSLSPQRTWDELLDWAGHARWVPCTRVEVSTQDPNSFVAFTGIGRVVLEDRMVLVEEAFDGTRGHCTVAKLGPILTGTARFSIEPGRGGVTSHDSEEEHAMACTKVTWVEDVRVRYLPGFLAALSGWVGARLFHRALGQMANKARAEKP